MSNPLSSRVPLAHPKSALYSVVVGVLVTVLVSVVVVVGVVVCDDVGEVVSVVVKPRLAAFTTWITPLTSTSTSRLPCSMTEPTSCVSRSDR
jgi:hypothetical protein